MPLLRYFGWVGSFLLATLFATNWYFPARIAPPSDVPLDHLITIRIHTDRKWPERLVFGATVAIPGKRPTLTLALVQAKPSLRRNDDPPTRPFGWRPFPLGRAFGRPAFASPTS